MSITIHAIWLERLRRIEDSTVSDEGHILIAQAILRRAITCFRGSTYEPGGDTKDFILARVRSALADEILHPIEVPQLRSLAPQHLPSDKYLFFLWYVSRKPRIWRLRLYNRASTGADTCRLNRVDGEHVAWVVDDD